MHSDKPWFHSRTIWGSLVAVAASLSALLGHPVHLQSQEEVADALLQIAAALASLYAVHGRVIATKRIG
jgi:hypothetical protein